MMGFIVEFSFTLFDYTYFTIIFLLLRHRAIKIERILTSVVLVSFVQIYSDQIAMPRFIMSLKDAFILVFYLMIHVRDFSKTSLVHALMVNALFTFCLTFYITLAHVCSFDITDTLVYGTYRISFVVFMKMFIVMFMLFLMYLFKKLEILVNDRIFFFFSVSFVICELLASFILELSVGYEDVNVIMVVLTGIIFLIFYILTNYSILKKKDIDLYMLQKSMELMDIYIDERINEQKQLKQLIHDTKNKFLEMEVLLDHKKYENISILIHNWQDEFHSKYLTSVCMNVYIDAVLRQVKKEYPHTNYHLQVQVPEKIAMESKDITALLTVIFNAICPFAKDSELKIMILSDQKGFMLKLTGELNNASNILKDSDHEYVFLKSIIDKYDGAIQIKREKDFHCKIFAYY